MLISNLNIIATPIEIQPTTNGAPRKIISAELKKIDSPLALLGFIFVGTRLISKENALLLKGRRHRIYWGLKKNNKIYIKFGWHKLKNFSDQEAKQIANNWHFDFFNQEGKYLIEKSGGILSPHNLIYEKAHIQI